MHITVQEAKKMWRYRNQWVALVDGRTVAHGKTLKDLRETAARKKIQGYAVHLVPDKPIIA